MRLDEIRPGVYQATVTAHELSALLAGARMSLSLMDQDPTGATAEARDTLAGGTRELRRRAGTHPRREGAAPGSGDRSSRFLSASTV